MTAFLCDMNRSMKSESRRVHGSTFMAGGMFVHFNVIFEEGLVNFVGKKENVALF